MNTFTENTSLDSLCVCETSVYSQVTQILSVILRSEVRVIYVSSLFDSLSAPASCFSCLL